MTKFLMAGFMLMAGPAVAAVVWNAPQDVAAVHALEQKNAVQLDGAALAQTYAPHAVVLDYMTSGIYQGRRAIRKAVTAVLSPLKSVSANLEEQNVVTDGSFACDLMTASFQYVTKSGKAGAISLRQMDALEKIDGRWEIVQEHISAPMNQKTGMAVMSQLPIRGDVVWPADITDGQTVSPARADEEITRWTNTSLRVVGIDAVLPFYGPGEEEEAIYGPVFPGNLRGKAELRAYYAPSMNSFESIVTKTPVLKVDSDGVLGAQIDIQDIMLHLRNGKSQALYWRQSDCLHRVGGQWYGILEMSSFPVDLKTGKSASKWSSFPMAWNGEKKSASAP